MCLAIGVAHPDHLGELLTHRQLAEWAEFAEIEPFGTPADDYRAALTAWAAFSTVPRRSRITPADMLPHWGPVDPPTPEQLKAKVRAMLDRATPRTPSTPPDPPPAT